MSNTDTTSDLRQDLEDFAAHYADYRQGIYDSNHEELDKRITILMRRIAAQKQRWEDLGYLQAVRERHDPVVQTSRLKDIAFRGRDTVRELAKAVEAELAALDGVIGEQQ